MSRLVDRKKDNCPVCGRIMKTMEWRGGYHVFHCMGDKPVKHEVHVTVDLQGEVSPKA